MDELKSDIHGERVADAHICDYCDSEVEVGEPVLYEVIRIADLPNLERLFNPPSGWFADAIRCRNCDIDEISPATDGFDEALVMVHLAESNGVLSIDASSTTVVDVSLSSDGYYPPTVPMQSFSELEDFGFARWIRVKYLLDQDDTPGVVMAILREGIERSKEVPPSVEQS